MNYGDWLRMLTREQWDLILKVLGTVGITLGLFLNWRTHSERSTFEMIDRLYSLCHTLEAHLLRDWRLSHLFCIGREDYERVKARVAEGVKADERGQLLIREQLFAIHVFIIYEQVFYQWKNSSKWLHQRRIKFLQDMLSYFTGRLLLNPRLQAFLQSDLTNEALHLEGASFDKLREDQIEVQEANGYVVPDFVGPFSSRGEDTISRRDAPDEPLKLTAK
jgi:hypothetical protein